LAVPLATHRDRSPVPHRIHREPHVLEHENAATVVTGSQEGRGLRADVAGVPDLGQVRSRVERFE